MTRISVTRAEKFARAKTVLGESRLLTGKHDDVGDNRIDPDGERSSDG